MRAMKIGAVLLGGLLVPCGAQRANAAPPKAPRHTLEEVAVMLASVDEDELRTALEAAASLPPRQVLPMLDERVRAGLPPVLLDVAIDTLMLLHDGAAGSLLVDLSRHRRMEVRKRAVEVLTQLRAPGATEALIVALGDPAAPVRGAAADGLGVLPPRGSFAPLLRALERGIEGSAAALGKIASSGELPSVLERVDHMPLEPLTPLFEAVLARPDLSEADKLACIEKLAALGSESARALLATLLEKLPSNASPRLRRALADGAQKAAP